MNSIKSHIMLCLVAAGVASLSPVSVGAAEVKASRGIDLVRAREALRSLDHEKDMDAAARVIELAGKALNRDDDSMETLLRLGCIREAPRASKGAVWYGLSETLDGRTIMVSEIWRDGRLKKMNLMLESGELWIGYSERRLSGLMTTLPDGRILSVAWDTDGNLQSEEVMETRGQSYEEVGGFICPQLPDRVELDEFAKSGYADSLDESLSAAREGLDAVEVWKKRLAYRPTGKGGFTSKVTMPGGREVVFSFYTRAISPNVLDSMYVREKGWNNTTYIHLQWSTEDIILQKREAGKLQYRFRCGMSGKERGFGGFGAKQPESADNYPAGTRRLWIALIQGQLKVFPQGYNLTDNDLKTATTALERAAAVLNRDDNSTKTLAREGLIKDFSGAGKNVQYQLAEQIGGKSITISEHDGKITLSVKGEFECTCFRGRLVSFTLYRPGREGVSMSFNTP